MTPVQRAWPWWRVATDAVRRIFGRSTAATIQAKGRDSHGRTLVEVPCCKKTIPLASWWDHGCTNSVLRKEEKTYATAPAAPAFAYVRR